MKNYHFYSHRLLCTIKHFGGIFKSIVCLTISMIRDESKFEHSFGNGNSKHSSDIRLDSDNESGDNLSVISESPLLKPELAADIGSWPGDTIFESLLKLSSLNPKDLSLPRRSYVSWRFSISKLDFLPTPRVIDGISPDGSFMIKPIPVGSFGEKREK